MSTRWIGGWEDVVMLHFTDATPIYLFTAPTDMRKSFACASFWIILSILSSRLVFFFPHRLCAEYF